MTLRNCPPFPHFPEPVSFLGEGFRGLIEKYCSDLHVLRVHDPEHHLWVQIPLETKQVLVLCEEERRLVTAASCNFSSVNLQGLANATGLSGHGQRSLLFLFQLKILEYLFSFCEAQGAEKLVITVDEANLDYLEVYNPFFASEEIIIDEKGERRIQVTIPADPLTYDDLLEFTGRLEHDFRRILWQEQRGNLAVQGYLKRHACV